MTKIRNSREARATLGSSALQSRVVRPPAIADLAQHQINLGACCCKPALLANWLGVSVEEIEKGESLMIRFAVQEYLKHRARVIIARVDQA